MYTAGRYGKTNDKGESRQREGLVFGWCVCVHRRHHNDQQNGEEDRQSFEYRKIWVNLLKRFGAWRSGDHSDQPHNDKDGSYRRRAHS